MHARCGPSLGLEGTDAEYFSRGRGRNDEVLEAQPLKMEAMETSMHGMLPGKVEQTSFSNPELEASKNDSNMKIFTGCANILSFTLFITSARS